MPPDVLGHLTHHPRPQRPQELRMVMCEMTLSRCVELMLVVACELRPALAVGDPPVPSVDSGCEAVVIAVAVHLERPAEGVAA